jgi:hypothetical protein
MFSVAWQDIPREQNPEYLPLSSTPEMKRLIMGTGIIYLPKKVKHRIRDKIKIQLVQRQKKSGVLTQYFPLLTDFGKQLQPLYRP